MEIRFVVAGCADRGRRASCAAERWWRRWTGVSELTAIGVGQAEIGAIPQRRVIELARYGMSGKAPALHRHPPPVGWRRCWHRGGAGGPGHR